MNPSNPAMPRRPARDLLKPHQPAATRAFTLIELLTVIAIIGILAAIIIPVTGRVRSTAKTSNCAGQMRQISMALILYQQENRGQLPAASVGSPSIIWQKALRPYLPLKGPSDTSQAHTIFTCPSAEYAGFTHEELAHTYTGTAALRGPNASGVLGTSLSVPRRYSTIAEPSRTAWVVEGKAAGGTARNCDSNVPWTNAATDISQTSTTDTVYMDFRHNNSMNATYADGSVRLLKFDEFRLITRERWEGRP